MSNPVYKHGPIGFDIAAKTEKFRLVKINQDGKIEHAGAEGAVFGAVTEAGRLEPHEAGAKHIAVHYGDVAIRLETVGDIKAGAAVFAAADGKVSGEGTVQVGVAVEDTKQSRTLTIINKLPKEA